MSTEVQLMERMLRELQHHNAVMVALNRNIENLTSTVVLIALQKNAWNSDVDKASKQSLHDALAAINKDIIHHSQALSAALHEIHNI